MRRLYFSILFIFSTLCLNAQQEGVKLLPLSTQPVLEYKAELSQAELLAPDSIDLPFIDDFSYEGPYPDRNLWLDNRVFVNSTMAYNPPSVGVATFDGINYNGKPYGQQGEYGTGDTLTSNYINLRTVINPDGSRRALTVADSVYMTFFLQPKGLCYEPLEKDSMVLEFKDNAGNWQIVKTYKGFKTYIADDSFPPFVMYFIPIRDAKYFYGKFQFRFYNYGQIDGANELWHLDYVKIGINRRFNNKTLDDLAFIDQPRPILTRYSSMPWRQAFPNVATEVTDKFNARFYNHFADQRNPTNTNVKITSSTGVAAVSSITILDGVNILPNQFYASLVKTYPTDFRTKLGTIPATTENLVVTSENTLDLSGQEGKDLARAAYRNDVVTRKTIFSNYFAYDDGTAEMMYAATGFSQQTAVQFKTNVADTLRGVQFSFPYVRKKYQFRDAKFNIQIWKDSLNTTPIYEKKNVSPYAVDAKVDSLHGITTYRLETKTGGKDTFIVIPANTTFYVGYQNVDNQIPIGLDRNSLDKAKYAFTKINTKWDTIPYYPLGALIIRAVVGNKPAQNTSSLSTHDLPLSEVMSVYPNPAIDRLYFDVKKGNDEDYEIGVFNLIGQLQKREILRGGQMQLSNMSQGIYFLKVRNIQTNQNYIHKFVVSQ
ncbi:MAG: T9SS type A sorting domain-containing protein [Saprospiraceae bacterium]|nr:T9SS type A sorting domain-containing protein [Saprospiraceae bacterium]